MRRGTHFCLREVFSKLIIYFMRVQVGHSPTATHRTATLTATAPSQASCAVQALKDSMCAPVCGAPLPGLCLLVNPAVMLWLDVQPCHLTANNITALQATPSLGPRCLPCQACHPPATQPTTSNLCLPSPQQQLCRELWQSESDSWLMG